MRVWEVPATLSGLYSCVHTCTVLFIDAWNNLQNRNKSPKKKYVWNYLFTWQYKKNTTQESNCHILCTKYTICGRLHSENQTATFTVAHRTMRSSPLRCSFHCLTRVPRHPGYWSLLCWSTVEERTDFSWCSLSKTETQLHNFLKINLCPFKGRNAQAYSRLSTALNYKS